MKFYQLVNLNDEIIGFGIQIYKWEIEFIWRPFYDFNIANSKEIFFDINYITKKQIMLLKGQGFDLL